MAITHRGDLRGSELEVAIRVAEEHEVVARAVALGEAQIERHPLSLGTARDRPGSRRPQSSAAWRATSADTAARSSADRTHTRSHPGVDRPPSSHRLAWALAVSGAVVLALLATGTVLALGGRPPIPVVADVLGRVDGDGDGDVAIVVFSWEDPGVEPGDAYVVAVDGIDKPAQRGTRLQLDAVGGTRMCASVRVTRDGKSGETSPERCVEVPEAGG